MQIAALITVNCAYFFGSLVCGGSYSFREVGKLQLPEMSLCIFFFNRRSEDPKSSLTKILPELDSSIFLTKA